MKEPKCCKRLMYQEIENSNTLLSICKVCGKEIRVALKISDSTGKDGITYAKLGVENFNIKLSKTKEFA